MQEEVENRTVTLSVNATKMTGRLLKEALRKYLAYQKSKNTKDITYAKMSPASKAAGSISEFQ